MSVRSALSYGPLFKCIFGVRYLHRKGSLSSFCSISTSFLEIENWIFFPSGNHLISTDVQQENSCGRLKSYLKPFCQQYAGRGLGKYIVTVLDSVVWCSSQTPPKPLGFGSTSDMPQIVSHGALDFVLSFGCLVACTTSIRLLKAPD